MNHYRALFDMYPFDKAIEQIQQEERRAWGYPGLDATWTSRLPAPGWECPRCYRIYAPEHPVCDHCNTEVDEREGGDVANTKLSFADIVNVLDAEILWCEKNPDQAFHREYRKGFINGLVQAKYLVEAKYQNRREDVSIEVDPEFYITVDGKCSNCDTVLDLDDGLAGLDFQVEESGVQPGTVYGPAVHWANGTICCPHCHNRLPIEVSS